MTFEEIIKNLQNRSMDWKNFGDNTSAMGYDSDLFNFMKYMGFDSDLFGYTGMAQGYTGMAQGFDGITAMGANGLPSWMAGAPDPSDQKKLTGWLNKQVASGAMTTYRMRAFYTADPLGGVDPVSVTFFAGTFNDGTFASNGDLLFTNASGDVATLTGQTRNAVNGKFINMRQLMDMMQTEPATLGFMRIRAKTVEQLGYDMGIIKNSQYGGALGNSIVPDDYDDPYQYQFTRVDVPMNVPLSRKDGFTWLIDADQTGNGIGMTMFIPTTLDNTKALQGKDPVRVLNGGQVPTFGTPTAPTSLQAFQTQALAVNPKVQAIIKNPMIPQSVGQQLIKTISKGG